MIFIILSHTFDFDGLKLQTAVREILQNRSTTYEKDSFNRVLALADDGGQQFVRRINICDWSVVRNRNNIKLKDCLRQKENLVTFVNAYSQKLDILGSKILTKNNMPGGKVIITTDD